MGETNGSKGKTAGLESHGTERLGVKSQLEILIKRIECISNEIQITCSQKSVI